MNNWTVVAEESDICAEEYYELWVDCLFFELIPEAACAYSHYLEQLRIAKQARKRVM